MPQCTCHLEQEHQTISTCWVVCGTFSLPPSLSPTQTHKHTVRHGLLNLFLHCCMFFGSDTALSHLHTFLSYLHLLVCFEHTEDTNTQTHACIHICSGGEHRQKLWSGGCDGRKLRAAWWKWHQSVGFVNALHSMTAHYEGMSSKYTCHWHQASNY